MQREDQISPAVLNEKETAHYVGMSCGFLRRCRMNGRTKSGAKGPIYVRVPGSRTIRYRIEDLDARKLENRYGL
jgi:hypothetical protein